LSLAVYPDTCEGKCFVITQQPKVGYQAVEGVVLACSPQP